jgi:hypothetical protein
MRQPRVETSQEILVEPISLREFRSRGRCLFLLREIRMRSPNTSKAPPLAKNFAWRFLDVCHACPSLEKGSNL